MSTVALVDYGSGNLPSARKALEKAAAVVRDGPRILVTDEPEAVAAADRIVLPGVGAFRACREALAAIPGLVEAIEEAARRRAVPFLGICVGMQLMAARGLEFGSTPGFGWIGGEVRALAPGGPALKTPHMGWNSLEEPTGALFAGLAAGTHMYFTHSFVLAAKETADVSAWTTHGERFAAAVMAGNLAGVQFHPEKSQAAGQRLLANFLSWRP